MKNITNLLFEAKLLKEIPRTGFHYLGSGKESVAEHSFLITFIAYVMSKLEPETDPLKLISMCLLHDLPEARMGDLNYVHKRYTKADEDLALAELTKKLFFGDDIKELLDEFNTGDSLEAQLARDADQISLILELKALQDQGQRGPERWLDSVSKRLKTETGKKIASLIMQTQWDEWWHEALVKE